MALFDHDYIQRCLNAVGQSNEVVYDSETTGLDWKRDCVIGHVFTVGPRPDETFYLPIRHAAGNIEGGVNLTAREQAVHERNKQHPVEVEIARLAKRPNVRFVGHNLKFDLHSAANHAIYFEGGLVCTSNNAALLNEEQRSFSLDTCAALAGVTAKKGQPLYDHMAKLFGGEANRDQMGNFWRTDARDPVVLDYTLGDGTSTWELWQWQRGRLTEEGLDRVLDIENRMIRVLFNMERRGIRIDEARVQWMLNKVNALLEEAALLLPTDMNVNSPAQVRRVMEAAGHTDWPTTAKGAPSFPEDFLKRYDIGRTILKARKYRNLKASFIEPMMNEHLYEGRVHANFNQLRADEYGVVTGRLSCNAPNLQQVPKRNKELAPMFRSIFLPEHGHVWSENDYKQQEFVVFAHYTGAKAIVDGYKAEPPIDIHQTVANMLGVERDPTAKRMNLGMIYGMGVPKLARSLGISEELAMQYMKQYHEMFPEAKGTFQNPGFLRKAEQKARARGYVFTLLGRRRRFPDLRLAHKAGNAIIQGGSADVTKLKMVELDDYFRSLGNGMELMLQVHDSLSFTVPEGCEKELAEAQRIMTSFGPEDAIALDVPMRVDSGVGPNWGVATFGEAP